jgi:hypothetical protein
MSSSTGAVHADAPRYGAGQWTQSGGDVSRRYEPFDRKVRRIVDNAIEQSLEEVASAVTIRFGSVSQAIDHLNNRDPERDEWLLRSAEQIRQWRAEDLFSREARAAEKAAGNNR